MVLFTKQRRIFLREKKFLNLTNFLVFCFIFTKIQILQNRTHKQCMHFSIEIIFGEFSTFSFFLVEIFFQRSVSDKGIVIIRSIKIFCNTPQQIRMIVVLILIVFLATIRLHNMNIFWNTKSDCVWLIVQFFFGIQCFIE